MIADDAPLAAPYLLPLAARVRALFKMDAGQAVYISELRTGVGGHFSYRQIAWEIYEALREPRMAAPPRLVRMAQAGLLGRKSKRGFYTYD